MKIGQHRLQRQDGVKDLKAPQETTAPVKSGTTEKVGTSGAQVPGTDFKDVSTQAPQQPKDDLSQQQLDRAPRTGGGGMRKAFLAKTQQKKVESPPSQDWGQKTFGLTPQQGQSIVEKATAFQEQRQTEAFGQQHFGMGINQAQGIVGDSDKFQQRRGALAEGVSTAGAKLAEAQKTLGDLKNGNIVLDNPGKDLKGLIRAAEGQVKTAQKALNTAQAAVTKFNQNTHMSDKDFSKLSGGVQKDLVRAGDGAGALQSKVQTASRNDTTARANELGRAVNSAREDLRRAESYLPKIQSQIDSGAISPQKGQVLLQEARGFQEHSAGLLTKLENTQKQFQLTGKLDKSDFARQGENVRPQNPEALLRSVQEKMPEATRERDQAKALVHNLDDQMRTLIGQKGSMPPDAFESQKEALRGQLDTANKEYAKREAILRGLWSVEISLDSSPQTKQRLGREGVSINEKEQGTLSPNVLESTEKNLQFFNLALHTGFQAV